MYFLHIGINYYVFVSARRSADIVFSSGELHVKYTISCSERQQIHTLSYNLWSFSHLWWRFFFNANHTQLWLFLFWFGVCSLRVRNGSLSSSTGGRWCSWGSLIKSSKAFISSLMDLVRAYQGLDYLPLAMGRGWLHVCVFGKCVRNCPSQIHIILYTYVRMCKLICCWCLGGVLHLTRKPWLNLKCILVFF